MAQTNLKNMIIDYLNVLHISPIWQLSPIWQKIFKIIIMFVFIFIPELFYSSIIQVSPVKGSASTI